MPFSVISTSESHAARHTSRRLGHMTEAFPFLFDFPVAFGIGGDVAAAVCEATPLGRSAPVSLDLSGAGRLSLNQIDEFAHE